MIGEASATIPFAGELFLRLAAEGRLIVDEHRAQELIDGLERTLAAVRRRLNTLRIWYALPGPRIDDLPEAMADRVIDSVFMDQLAPGQLQRAAAELPKYIEALRSAARTL